MDNIDNKVYIDNKSAYEEIERYISLVKRDSLCEYVPVLDSLGRVTAKAVYAFVCDPVYNAAAMDGICVKSADTKNASELSPVILKREAFNYINTGEAVVQPYDSVIMIEDVIRFDSGEVKIISPSYPWQYVRVVGESVVAGEMLLTSNHKIRPMDIGAMIAGGVKEVPVYVKKKVGVIPTGHELVNNSDELGQGKLMEYNSKVFYSLITEYGGEPKCYPIVRDTKDELKTAIQAALSENDMVVVNAGSSAGSKDYTVSVIEEMGEVISHGLAIKPGKPTILARINDKPVIGIPGYPVSAYLLFEKCVKPLVITGSESNFGTVSGILSRNILSSLKHRELVRVSLGFVNDRWIVTPLERGAASIMSLVKADGILEIPEETEGMEAGQAVSVNLLKDKQSIKDTLVSIGSHDLILDVIADKLSLKSAHVGSMGGIMAIGKGECHIAPVHLLDEETGEYNTAYVKKYLNSEDYVIIRGVGRVQGFMTRKDSGIKCASFADLAKDGITFANRQRGAGTRMLLDFNLKKLGINSLDIKGYQKEYTTHMAVAASVQSGVSDIGLGVLSAASSLGLDFVPVCEERYDFVVRRDMLSDMRISKFIETLRSESFSRELERLGGYTANAIGDVLEE